MSFLISSLSMVIMARTRQIRAMALIGPTSKYAEPRQMARSELGGRLQIYQILARPIPLFTNNAANMPHSSVANNSEFWFDVNECITLNLKCLKTY
jgi:hypothetical protein